jgi:AcrR family transcriptional regulator
VFNQDPVLDPETEEMMGRQAGRQQRPESIRRAILDAALQLFVTHGYAQVSIRNIASKVGYSPGAIYSYFLSKDDIFLALAEEGFRKLGAAQLAMPATPDALEDLADTAWRLYAFSKEQPQYFALVFLDRHVPRIGPESERFAFMSEIKTNLLARVQRCVDEGLFPPTLQPTVALRLLWTSVIGVASLRLSQRLAPGEDADALIRDAISTTIAGLRVAAAVYVHPVQSRPDSAVSTVSA